MFLLNKLENTSSFLSAQPDSIRMSARAPFLLQNSKIRPNYIFNNDVFFFFLDFCAQNCPLIFSYINPF